MTFDVPKVNPRILKGAYCSIFHGQCAFARINGSIIKNFDIIVKVKPMKEGTLTRNVCAEPHWQSNFQLKRQESRIFIIGNFYILANKGGWEVKAKVISMMIKLLVKDSGPFKAGSLPCLLTKLRSKENDK